MTKFGNEFYENYWRNSCKQAYGHERGEFCGSMQNSSKSELIDSRKQILWSLLSNWDLIFFLFVDPIPCDFGRKNGLISGSIFSFLKYI